MSHIATEPSSPEPRECRYYRRAFSVAAFYASPMSLRIKALREAKGWTQSHLAEKARISRSQLAMIENETRPANTLRLNAIASALGVSPQNLFEGDDSDLIAMIRSLSPSDREMIVRMAEALAKPDAQN